MSVNVEFDTYEKKKRILIVEDEMINQEMLQIVLKDQYSLVSAFSGGEALEMIHTLKGRLDLVLLDLNLPDLYGIDILKLLKEESFFPGLPVIVMTADRAAEVESLELGAMDFIPKPYPKPDVIRARIIRTLELHAGQTSRGFMERDALTGLYNRDLFFRYAEEFDADHPEEAMDAIAFNINHFHMINERFGKAYGDEVLHRIGQNAMRLAKNMKGIACRRESDTFLIYCPHSHDYTGILDALSDGASGEGKGDLIVRIRMGVYPKADKTIDIERRFDRAKLAADTVRSTFTKAVAIYDSALHESAIFGEQLLIDFPKAIEEKQFVIYYQPKYDIHGEEPVLSSAEALIRWFHPEFGMISPGVFIPLFEKNGLIRQLDSYVWEGAAVQMRDWKDRFGFTVPVSVNVSRVDMYDPYLVEELNKLVFDNRLKHSDLMLELTESAYTEDAEDIIRTVHELRKEGFLIEMDDFGSGYSSLNMLSNLPVDALKLDMQFIRSAFKNGKNTRMLEIVIEIADTLSVPVIAEGVETAEQLFTLKGMGCDIVQGYYLSKPVPADRFEGFLRERVKRNSSIEHRRKRSRKVSHDRFTYEAMHDPDTGLYNGSAFDLLLYDADQVHAALFLADIERYEEMNPEKAIRAVKRVATVLRKSFRSTDFIFRLREDEFAVILTRISSAQKNIIYDKILDVCGHLLEETEEEPAVTLIVGLAFGDRDSPGGDILQDADVALNNAKSDRQERLKIY